jgi:hypothetical protein
MDLYVLEEEFYGMTIRNVGKAFEGFIQLRRQ